MSLVKAAAPSCQRGLQEYNFQSFVFGGTGAPMRWFRRTKSMDDMKGLSSGGGFAGCPLAAGVCRSRSRRRHLSGAKGTIDACEWVPLRPTRSLASTRRKILISGLVGRRLGRLALHQQQGLGGASQALPGDDRDGGRLVTS